MKNLNRKKSSFNLIDLLVKLWNALTSIFKGVVSKLTPKFLLSSNPSKYTRSSNGFSQSRNKSKSELIDPFNEEAYKYELTHLPDEIKKHYSYLKNKKLKLLFTLVQNKKLITTINCLDKNKEIKDTKDVEMDLLSSALKNIFINNREYTTLSNNIQFIMHKLFNNNYPITLDTDTRQETNKATFMLLSAQLITLIISSENVLNFCLVKKHLLNNQANNRINGEDKSKIESVVTTSNFSLANATCDTCNVMQNNKFDGVNLFNQHDSEKIYFRENNKFGTRPLSIPEQLVRNLMLRRDDIESGSKPYYDLLLETERIYLEYATNRKHEIDNLKESIDGQNNNNIHDDVTVNTTFTIETTGTLETSLKPFAWKEKIQSLRKIHNAILKEEKVNNHGTTPVKMKNRGKS